MQLLKGTETESLLEGLVYAKKQVGTYWVDLTVAEIHRFTKPGALDFGGSEYAAAETVAIGAERRAEDDKYGWWELEPGIYKLRFNEFWSSLPDNLMAFLAPHPRLLASGASHPSGYLFSGDDLSATLEVPQAGVALKKNCRTTRLQIFRLT